MQVVPNPLLVGLGLMIIAAMQWERVLRFTAQAIEMTGERVLPALPLHPSKVPKHMAE